MPAPEVSRNDLLDAPSPVWPVIVDSAGRELKEQPQARRRGLQVH